uniref:Uncharacterized protein n=1 Tax=Avena sativa TaxID=4498 RepID=A0ACD5WB74_AVESA
MSTSSPTSSPPSTAGGGGGGARCISPTSSRRKGSPHPSGGGSRKSPGSRDCGSSLLKSVNKSTSQFKKSMIRRSGSSNEWFPRKKTESFLKRKIKRLQETDGMTASLHDTLGNANPHYTRMAREKIAAGEAARKAMEARKTAMVEASWCKILQAARVQNKEAEELMEKAKLHATEAFEKARVIGVMMYDRPDCPNQQYEVESSAQTGERSTHKITASFQTGFEVDMEVAAALKKAFVKLANSPDSSNQEEFKDLLWKISQNPDATDGDVNSEAEQPLGDCNNEEINNFKLNNKTSRNSICPSDFNTTNLDQPADLVDIMLERIKALHEDELSSLAVIVATSGLNAALQNDKGNYHEMKPVNRSHRSQSRRYSTAASFIDIQGPNKEVASELPSLDKFLVKHLSKLEREVQEAKEAGRKVTSVKPVTQDIQGQLTGDNAKALESASDLGNILVKNVSRFEKDMLEAKKSNQRVDSSEGSYKDVKKDAQASAEESGYHDPQSEILCNSDLKMNCDSRGSGEESKCIQPCPDSSQEDKENKALTSHGLPPLGAKGNQGGKRLTRIEAAKLEALKSFCTKDGSALEVGLDKVFVKPINRLEMEKKKALEQGQTNMQKDRRKDCHNTTVSLDEILVKRIPRLDREKMEYEKRNGLGEGQRIVSHDQRKYGNNATASESLDQVLVKRVSRLEREKMEYEKRNTSGEARSGVQTDQEKHGNNDNTSNSLGQILVKHVSMLEMEKIEPEKKGDSDALLAKKSDTQYADGVAGGLADIFVRRPMKLEQAKQETAAAEEKLTSVFNPAVERRRAREKELLDSWGGEGLGSLVKPHLSKVTGVQTDQEKHGSNDKASDSLDQVLVKHVSRLEKEKLEHQKKGDGDTLLVKKSDTRYADGAPGSLADIFVRRPTKLEQDKQEAAAAAEENLTSVFRPAEERRRARQKELLAAWGGEGLASSVKPRLSKIESEKAACKTEGERKQERIRAREKELLDAWGGVGLGNSMKPHLSKIERDKAAWRRLEEEQKQRCGTTKL